MLRPRLPSPQGQRHSGKEMPPVEADLGLLHLNGGLRKLFLHPRLQALIERQFPGLAVKVKQQV